MVGGGGGSCSVVYYVVMETRFKKNLSGTAQSQVY